MKKDITIEELQLKIEKFPRIKIAHTPTPLEFMPNLSKNLGGPKIWIKREDMTGLAYGGNKARHYEFEMPEIFTYENNMIKSCGWCYILQEIINQGEGL